MRHSSGRSLIPGKRVKLRKDVLRHVKIREWEFLEMEKEGVYVLTHPEKGYILEVSEADIDWSDFGETPGEKEELPFQERRKHRRISLKLPLEYMPPRRGTPFSGRTLEVSKTGLSVLLPIKLEAGDELGLKLLPGCSKEIEFSATVVHVDPLDGEEFRYGMRIVKISPPSGAIWGKLLSRKV